MSRPSRIFSDRVMRHMLGSGTILTDENFRVLPVVLPSQVKSTGAWIRVIGIMLLLAVAACVLYGYVVH